MEVDPSHTHMYGCAAVDATDDHDVVNVKYLVERPSAADAPSNLAVIGRHVPKPEIFDTLENTQPGKGGEIQLTDALEALADNKTIAGPVLRVVFRGRRYDTGDRLDYIKSNVLLALTPTTPDLASGHGGKSSPPGCEEQAASGTRHARSVMWPSPHWPRRTL